MSKPLELKIYPPIPPNPRPDEPLTRGNPKFRACMEWDDARAKERRLMWQKRLTSAEVAAEYWQAHAFHERAVRGQSCIELLMEKEVEVWTRFATLPHYDEVQR